MIHLEKKLNHLQLPNTQICIHWEDRILKESNMPHVPKNHP